MAGNQPRLRMRGLKCRGRADEKEHEIVVGGGEELCGTIQGSSTLGMEEWIKRGRGGGKLIESKRFQKSGVESVMGG